MSTRQLPSRRRLSLVNALASIAVLSTALTGCAQLDPDWQDAQACNKISEILVAAGETGFGSTSSSSGKTSSDSQDQMDFEQMAYALETEAIPLASMKFGEKLTKWVRGLRKLRSGSMFSAASGWISGTTRFVQISTHCIALELKDV